MSTFKIMVNVLLENLPERNSYTLSISSNNSFGALTAIYDLIESEGRWLTTVIYK